MNLSLTATILWAAGFALNAALLAVLLYKRRYGTVPWFTTWIAYGSMYTVALFFSFRFGSRQLYKDVYWSGAFLDLLLQIAVVLEIAACVLRRSGRWVEGARIRLIVTGMIAPEIAFAMAWFMTPAAESKIDAWAARTSLFTTLLICLLFTSIMAASQQLGLAWRSHVMREGYGLTIWVLVAFLTDTLHAYWRTAENFTALEYVRMVFYLGSLLYWIGAFWIPEKVPLVLPQDIIDRMKALGVPLEYDMSQTDGIGPK